ncbi:TonB-dependent receptor plug domain-containing protein [Aquimarina brevivitae]|uniref:TonB-dependent receptor-like protein n=1 Tax=Aquimarina brevivitae TaxID=323412 RepID=A0A4Q7PEU6_9FLAO|nr:TonB-dependent receptor plug domain-containing protein [Aquimarina brevivitae]RZS98956.1 TonB-dependent receptor-like protein [Aquimarina brevivitae]
MKKSIIIILLLWVVSLPAQTIVNLSSIAVDRITRQPISYANVGFENRGLGTVTNETGFFELSFFEKRIEDSDILQITADGYYPLRLPRKDLEKVFEKTKVLYLTPRNAEGKELSTADNFQAHTLGHQRGKFATTINVEVKKGYEVASLVKINEGEIKVNKLRFFELSKSKEKVKLRLNFYGINSMGLPEDKIAESIMYTTDPSREEQVIDLASNDISFAQDFVVGIEFIDGNKQVVLAVSDQIGTSFIKYASQDDWSEVPFQPLAIQLDVLRSAESMDAEVKTSEPMVRGEVSSLGKPVQGVEVHVKGKKGYTHTRADGSFVVQAELGDIIEFNSIVNHTKTVIVKSEDLKVKLEPKYDILEEVILQADETKDPSDERMVMTLFGPRHPETLGFRAIHRRRNELNKFAVTLGQLIRGRFPTVRGSSSITLSNFRTVVLDGVVFTGDTNFINPDIIESITVVPSAAGNVMYGSYGRNGIIYVTTINAKRNWEFAKRNKVKNNLIVKGNVYEDTAQQYDYDFTFKSYPFKADQTLEEARAIYAMNIDKNYDNLNFFLSAYDFFDARDKDYAVQVLHTAESVMWNNPKGLRALAFIYERDQLNDKSLKLYNRIGQLEPTRAQTYVDLAQSYFANKHYKKAFSLYKLILDNKIPGVVFSKDVHEIAVTEMKHLVTVQKVNVDYRDLHLSYYSKAMDLDSRILIEWNNPLNQFEVQFVNPEDKYFKWAYSSTSNPETSINSEKEGYQTKEFYIENAKKGSWLINLKNLNAVRETNTGSSIPSLIKCTIYTNYGMPNETKEIKILDLNAINEYTSVASMTL